MNAMISDGIDTEEEARMWSVFSIVYEKEVRPTLFSGVHGAGNSGTLN